MNKLIVLSSGSHGNSYILECDGEQLLIECGIAWKEILKGLNYDLSKVNSCLISHLHKDHSLSVSDVLKNGIEVYTNEEVKSVYTQAKVLKKGIKTQIGGFKVQRVDLFHNCTCIGFLIQHPSLGKLLFCTDTNCIPYRFKNVNHFIIESNYSFDLIVDKMCDNDYSASASENHMEINATIEFLKENYSADCMTIVLIHLSKGNADEKLFKQMVQDELGFKNVHIAKKGVEIELNSCEF